MVNVTSDMIEIVAAILDSNTTLLYPKFKGKFSSQITLINLA